ncbi:hypothetical protein BD410DRAFT_784252 [Rickenella mellea]|uniref:Uncharacterized protein n=1 Tax=Rickenella mellea TaxID=50990 RepID=A0A4Y7QG63_9AGAM|nr:hypothetical protein BD410DRAFT_784252 [Rickenella mellea]
MCLLDGNSTTVPDCFYSVYFFPWSLHAESSSFAVQRHRHTTPLRFRIPPLHGAQSAPPTYKRRRNMIVDHHKPTTSEMQPAENPPSYDLATSETGPSSPTSSTAKHGNGKMAIESQPKPMYIPAGPSSYPSPMVYHYQNPMTGEHVTSLLPPNHPEMICLQEGRHIREVRYGLVGILTAIFWFPIGIGLCLLDRRVRCTRCGLHIEDGLCS